MVKLTRLRAVRERKALTQEQLAERAGISRPTIARIETYRVEPYPTTVRKIAEALGVYPETLIEPEAPPDELPIRRSEAANQGNARRRRPRRRQRWQEGTGAQG